jgi:hypothetical protein
MLSAGPGFTGVAVAPWRRAPGCRALGSDQMRVGASGHHSARAPQITHGEARRAPHPAGSNHGRDRPALAARADLRWIR